MVSWEHFSPQVAQHAMMLFEGDLSLYSDGMLDLGLVNSVSACGGHGLDMGRRPRLLEHLLQRDSHQP